MIGKLLKGRGARGLINYLLGTHDHNGDERPRAEVIGGTLAGRNERELAAEFGRFHQLRPRLGVHVAHMSLRVPADERPLSDDEWRAVGDRWATGMGFTGYMIVSHGDHIHVAASRICLDGSVVSDAHDWRRSESLIRDIERDFGLRQIEASHLLEPERAGDHRKAPTMARIALAERGKASPSEQVADVIEATIGRETTVSEFIEALEAAGIHVQANVASTGKLNGFSYTLDGVTVTAKALGRSFTLSNLLKRGLAYDPDRDLAALRRTSERAADRQLEGQADGVDHAAPGGDRAGGEAGAGAGEPVGGPDAAGRGDGGANGGDQGNPAASGAAVPAGAPGGLGLGQAVDRAGLSSIESAAIPAPATEDAGGETGGSGDGQAADAESVAPGHRSGPDAGGGVALAGVSGRPAVAGDQDGEIRPAKQAADKVKADIWRAAYGVDLDDRLKAQLRYVDRQRTVYLRDGATLRDYGDRITTTRSTPAAIEILIAQAKAKGWSTVELTGSDAFKHAAAAAAVRAGLDVSNPELAAVVAAEKKKLTAAADRIGPRTQRLRDVAALPPGGLTEAAVRQQIAALGVEKFEVGVIPYKGAPEHIRPEGTRTFDAEQTVKALGWLRRKNSQGFDIYVRPAPLSDEQCHPIVLLDDLDAAALDRLREDGYEPALVVETSPANFQAWVRLGSEPISREEATEAARQLARQYGGDPGAADWRHFGRLSGFTNRKPSRVQDSGLPPFCRLREATAATATKGPEYLEWVRAISFEKQQQEERAAARARQLQRDQAAFRRPDGLKDAVSAFLEIRQRITKAKPDGSPDESAKDFGAAVRMLQHHHSDQVAAALRNSPDIGKRKRHVEEYVKRTLEAAIREYERQEAARAAQAAQASAYRPKPRSAGGRGVRR